MIWGFPYDETETSIYHHISHILGSSGLFRDSAQQNMRGSNVHWTWVTVLRLQHHTPTGTKMAAGLSIEPWIHIIFTPGSIHSMPTKNTAAHLGDRKGRKKTCATWLYSTWIQMEVSKVMGAPLGCTQNQDKWRCPKMGVPPNHPYFIFGFSMKLNHPAIGYPHDYGTPHIMIPRSSHLIGQKHDWSMD